MRLLKHEDERSFWDVVNNMYIGKVFNDYGSYWYRDINNGFVKRNIWGNKCSYWL